MTFSGQQVRGQRSGVQFTGAKWEKKKRRKAGEKIKQKHKDTQLEVH